jgi:transcriptional regulator with XRE-family HTH domain
VSEEVNTYGLELQRCRLARGLSIKKLAKQSAVSRRHINSAERGLNISIDVLKKLMRALGMTDIDVGDGISIRAESPLNVAEIRDVLLELQRSAELTQSVTATIRSFERRVGKSIRNDTPDEDGVVAKASALIGAFTAHVRSLRDPAELANVEKGISGLLSTGRGTSPSSPRKRKRTA